MQSNLLLLHVKHFIFYDIREVRRPSVLISQVEPIRESETGPTLASHLTLLDSAFAPPYLDLPQGTTYWNVTTSLWGSTAGQSLYHYSNFAILETLYHVVLLEYPPFLCWFPSSLEEIQHVLLIFSHVHFSTRKRHLCFPVVSLGLFLSLFRNWNPMTFWT